MARTREGSFNRSTTLPQVSERGTRVFRKHFLCELGSKPEISVTRLHVYLSWQSEECFFIN